MTLRELLENSNLAALGLLDPEDHAKFDRALANAPEGVRRQVVLEQARWASSGVLLPDASPPAALKDRVLDGVRNAMVEASIAADDFSLLREQVQERHGLGPRKVHAGWRAGAMGLMAAVVVLGGAFMYVYQTNQANTSSISGNSLVTEYANKFEGEFEDSIFDALTVRSVFSVAATNDSEAFRGKAAIFCNADWAHSRLLTSNLPRVAGEEYRVVEVDDASNVVRHLHAFEGGTQTQALTLPKLAKGTRLAIVRVVVGSQDQRGNILLTASVA